MPFPAKINRNAILKLGLRILERKGIEHLSMRGLARKLKVAPNALYNYFRNRQALEAAIAVEGYRVFGEYLKRVTPGGSAERVLPALSRACLCFAREHKKLFVLMSRTRLQKSERTAIHTELCGVVNQKLRIQLTPDQASKAAFALFAMLQGIIIAEQSLGAENPEAASAFAIAALIPGLARTRSSAKVKPRK